MNKVIQEELDTNKYLKEANNMNKDILGTNKYFNSIVDENAFYTKHKETFILSDIKYNRELLTKAWKEEKNLEGTEEEIDDMVKELLWEKLRYSSIYYEPKTFNETIAIECGLTPFTHKGFNLLALSGYGMNLLLKLDAYQILAQDRIDRNSKFFSINDKEPFEYVVGEKVMNKINEILNREEGK